MLKVRPFEVGMRAKPDEFETQAVDSLVSKLQREDRLGRCDLRCVGRWSPKVNAVVFMVYGEVSEHLLTRKFNEEAQHTVRELYNKVRAPYAQLEAIVKAEFTPQVYALASNGAAGDSGRPLAVAYADTPLNLPWERFLAVELRNMFYAAMKAEGRLPPAFASITEVERLEGLRGDGKIEVATLYNGPRAVSIESVTIALEHEKSLPVYELREKVTRIINDYLRHIGNMYDLNLVTEDISVNGNGAWNIGGYIVDAGSSEAKPHRQAFGADGQIEDSLSGEDPTKVSSTGTFAARELAVRAVRELSAQKAVVTLRYVIGLDTVGINIELAGPRKVEDLKVEELNAWAQCQFNLAIPAVIGRYDLTDPIWREMFATNADYFHSEKYPWNVKAVPVRASQPKSQGD